MSDVRNLGDLKHLTEAQMMAAQSKMANLQAREKGLRDNLSGLVVQRRQAAICTTLDDAATAAGANMRWQKWADAKRAVINMELAAVLGQKANAQANLKRAFGKDQALGALIERQSRAARALQLRRAD